MKQSFHINTNQISSRRPSILMPPKLYWAELRIAASQVLLDCTSIYIKFEEKLKLRFG